MTSWLGYPRRTRHSFTLPRVEPDGKCCFDDIALRCEFIQASKSYLIEQGALCSCCRQSVGSAQFAGASVIQRHTRLHGTGFIEPFARIYMPKAIGPIRPMASFARPYCSSLNPGVAPCNTYSLWHAKSGVIPPRICRIRHIRRRVLLLTLRPIPCPFKAL